MTQEVSDFQRKFSPAGTVPHDVFEENYQASISNPEVFWGEMGKRLHWFKPYSVVKNISFARNNVSIKWYEDGELNVAYNCIDRHLPEKANQVAYYLEGDQEGPSDSITYQELHDEVGRLANALKSQGIVKGDRVAIYMPMIPQAVYAMLACARIGAIHSVIFGGFSASAIADRLNDCDVKLVMTADQGKRAGNSINLKKNVDMALADNACPSVKNAMVYRYTKADIEWNEDIDLDWQALVDEQSTDCPAVSMNAEDPLFILYTSGSTGKPKGVVHTSGGYLVYASMTQEIVFGLQPDDVYWCAADVGWITGHSYMVYGPLANGVTSVLFEGVPTYPDAGRIGRVVDKYKVNLLYTAPTAVRALMAKGDEAIETSSRDSLRVLGSVGEPINPEAWSWYHQKIGNSKCPIADTWWQTETGGMMMTPRLTETNVKPGACTSPIYGVQPALMDPNGNVIEDQGVEVEGGLVLTDSWPGQARTVYGDHERFEQTYFSTYDGVYFTGDGARRDADGDYWITGRVDDVLNVSGHRLGTAEIESALVAHPSVAEAAVVGYPHDLKGQGLYVYVSPIAGVTPDDALTKSVRQFVRQEVGPVATPDLIQWTVRGLPKTRSGKIMRRILRKIAANEHEQLGDTTTLADPSVVDDLIDNRLND
ncbi:acetate--CoA ligase [Marinomonas mediterranea]|jgi:acetyl-coenzyme A synthetase (EC 6.2.1.1)|uniref:Acetate--CoA ligase n=1 Tax=Marinomonas mediterranea (strain ATCC 700492 / JCM 21426 / NBRC 103028 / MMB-1) TaxID=717774 RepID=F2K2F7_MARM1|nr:acetate--CoA ligase [Marinomonas mediterranea]ADZ92337.1 acetate/CoA ligase [Marinomonas mediterranea MMB-1]WCN10289.1 acetate--CoA ligase [Marinomonas mediterranea]WCN14335.1 acetate--CoA ligase [Marinomonas mediterranea]WCN18386.1 acetate--CoA ligase [Marinomonas mediterranea MMB-1]